MRNALIVFAIAGQVVALAFMAGQREWILRHGPTLFLRTAPIDPRDPMRGDYIRFDFEESRIPKEHCRDGIQGWFDAAKLRDENHSVQDRLVYATLRLDENRVAEIVSVSDRRPDSGLFLRARAVSVHEQRLEVRFGAEAKYTEQGVAKRFEEEARRRAGAPVDVEVALAGNGMAVLKDYRWEPLAITVQPRRTPPAQRSVGPPRPRIGLAGISVGLKNVSDKPIAIVVRPNGESFRLVPNDRWYDPHYRAVDAVPPTQPVSPAMVHVLAPGESLAEDLDLTQAAWFIRDTKKPAQPAVPLRDTDEAGMAFRIEYRGPSAAECVGLPNASALWHGRLRSRPIGAGVD